MTSQLELSLRAALCRQLAKREPANRTLWMAEAENWSRLSNQELPGEAGIPRSVSGVLCRVLFTMQTDGPTGKLCC